MDNFLRTEVRLSNGGVIIFQKSSESEIVMLHHNHDSEPSEEELEAVKCLWTKEPELRVSKIGMQMSLTGRAIQKHV